MYRKLISGCYVSLMIQLDFFMFLECSKVTKINEGPNMCIDVLFDDV